MTETVLQITPAILLPLTEISFSAIRASGPGGQHVNKTSTAIQARFDVNTSSLPDWAKARIRDFSDHHITRDGMIIIKVHTHRSQTRNRAEALDRLTNILQRALHRPKPRKPTRASRAQKVKRLEAKSRRSRIKVSRRPVRGDE